MRKQLKKSQEQLAEALGISRSTYADYEKGRTEPTASLLINISEYFKVDLKDLLTSDLGSPLFQQKDLDRANLNYSDVRILAITLNSFGKENIELVKVNVSAGYSIGYNNPNFIKNLPRFNLPGLDEGSYRAFEIMGDSMLPINSGSIVVGRYVEGWQDLKNGNRYVVVIKNEGVFFKRILNKTSESKKVVLYSDNPQYQPMVVSVVEIVEAWEIIAFIGFLNKTDSINDVILDKLCHIEQKLNDLILS